MHYRRLKPMASFERNVADKLVASPKSCSMLDVRGWLFEPDREESMMQEKNEAKMEVKGCIPLRPVFYGGLDFTHRS